MMNVNLGDDDRLRIGDGNDLRFFTTEVIVTSNKQLETFLS